jgi:L-serine deaminase
MQQQRGAPRLARRNHQAWEPMGQSAARTYMVVGVTKGGLMVGASADTLKRRANHQSGHVEAKYKLWSHLQARILP